MIESTVRAKLDQHFIAAHAKLYRSITGGLFEVTSNWVRGFSGLQIPSFNIFIPLTNAGLTDETLADTAAFFFSRGMVYAIELVHDSFPHGPGYLNERHYQSLPPQPAMVLAGTLNGVPLNPSITIERANTIPALTALCSLLHWTFDFSLQDMARLYSGMQLKEEVKNIIRHYLVFSGEKPIGAGTIICLNGVASVWNLCTLDEYRRQGVATTLLSRMIDDANKCGCSFTMLYATPLAYHLLCKLGFTIYAQRQWFLPPDLDYEEE